MIPFDDYILREIGSKSKFDIHARLHTHDLELDGLKVVFERREGSNDWTVTVPETQATWTGAMRDLKDFVTALMRIRPVQLAEVVIHPMEKERDLFEDFEFIRRHGE